jgi:S1-C subfamily serine protease
MGLAVLSVATGAGCGAAAPTEADIQATVVAAVRATLTAQPTPSQSQAVAPLPDLTATPVPTDDAHGWGWAAQIQRANSIGSGVVVSPEGYILTNQQVIAGGGSIRVRLADGRMLLADLIAADSDVDLALIRVPADGLTAATLSDPSTLQQGDPLVAVGFVLNLSGQQSVTRGVFSGRRSFSGSPNYIQADVAIKPGMRGGAMVNRTGAVVGINVDTIDQTNGPSDQVTSFAVPSDLASSFIQSARSGQLLTWSGTSSP